MDAYSEQRNKSYEHLCFHSPTTYIYNLIFGCFIGMVDRHCFVHCLIEWIWLKIDLNEIESMRSNIFKYLVLRINILLSYFIIYSRGKYNNFTINNLFIIGAWFFVIKKLKRFLFNFLSIFESCSEFFWIPYVNGIFLVCKTVPKKHVHAVLTVSSVCALAIPLWSQSVNRFQYDIFEM